MFICGCGVMVFVMVECRIMRVAQGHTRVTITIFAIWQQALQIITPAGGPVSLRFPNHHISNQSLSHPGVRSTGSSPFRFVVSKVNYRSSSRPMSRGRSHDHDRELTRQKLWRSESMEEVQAHIRLFILFGEWDRITFLLKRRVVSNCLVALSSVDS